MNKKNVLQSVKVIILGLVLSLGIMNVSAALEGANPPANNVPGPINEGPSSQIKNGGLSVNAFTARGNSLFYQPVKVYSFIGGNNKTLCADNCGNVVFCDATADLCPSAPILK